MESASKKCKIYEENNERDRLSELPDQLLLHILSLMPTLDAVRTVLLRRFGNLWSMVPSLVFDDGEILFGKGYLTKNWAKDQVSRNELNMCFTSFIRNVLLFHKRLTIDKFDFAIFELDWLDNYYSRRSRDVLDEIKMWVKFAVQKEVKVLGFEFICCRVDAGFVLPRCVFTSQFLVEVKLVGVVIRHLGDVRMGALKSLGLSRFHISNELFRKLVSGCPSLQVLEIEDQYELNELRFTAPSIQELALNVNPCLLDCPNVKVLNIRLFDRASPPVLVDVSSLREVIVWSLDSADQINELVKMFYMVEVFKLHLNVARPLQLKDPNLPQTRWKHLHINSQLHSEDDLLSISRLLRSSPHLEEVEFVEHTGPLVHEDCSELMLELPPPFLTAQLKTVTLRGYVVRCQGLLRVVEFLLKNATALQKIVIIPKKYELAAIDEVEFVEKLSDLLRASSIAKIVIGLNVYLQQMHTSSSIPNLHFH